jgi:hypothetical protein
VSFSYAGASYPDGLPGIGGEHLLKERRRLSDYLLLHKVFNTKRNLKSKIKKKSIFVSQRNSEIKKII